mmetsp:Transcript_40345/g.104442  ORF Transcript_40345/g.104442 Transcript_40345/m.104442 type:complete len:293 (+) Transcript_40345:1238-2116(+)
MAPASRFQAGRLPRVCTQVPRARPDLPHAGDEGGQGPEGPDRSTKEGPRVRVVHAPVEAFQGRHLHDDLHVGPHHVRPRLRADQRRALPAEAGGPSRALALAHAALDGALDAQGHSPGELPRGRLRSPPLRRPEPGRVPGAALDGGLGSLGRRPGRALQEEHRATVRRDAEGGRAVAVRLPTRIPHLARRHAGRLRARGRPRCAGAVGQCQGLHRLQARGHRWPDPGHDVGQVRTARRDFWRRPRRVRGRPGRRRHVGLPSARPRGAAFRLQGRRCREAELQPPPRSRRLRG